MKIKINSFINKENIFMFIKIISIILGAVFLVASVYRPKVIFTIIYLILGAAFTINGYIME